MHGCLCSLHSLDALRPGSLPQGELKVRWLLPRAKFSLTAMAANSIVFRNSIPTPWPLRAPVLSSPPLLQTVEEELDIGLLYYTSFFQLFIIFFCVYIFFLCTLFIRVKKGTMKTSNNYPMTTSEDPRYICMDNARRPPT